MNESGQKDTRRLSTKLVPRCILFHRLRLNPFLLCMTCIVQCPLQPSVLYPSSSTSNTNCQRWQG